MSKVAKGLHQNLQPQLRNFIRQSILGELLPRFHAGEALTSYLKMKVYQNQFFEGERPLFAEKNLALDHVRFYPGESALKHSENVQISQCNFMGKYPLWHSANVNIHDTEFQVYARAAIWYTRHLHMQNCRVDAPKMFRECSELDILETTFSDAQETLWNCTSVKLERVTMEKADYVFMNGRELEVRNFDLQGNYSFQGAKNVTIHDSKLQSKDAFWHAENVTVYDSLIEGEYLGWHSKNLTLINCTIIGEQPLCYAQNLKLVNCQLFDAELGFEYSTVEADIKGTIQSIKNPAGGRIKAFRIDEIIIDENCINPGACEIIQTETQGCAGCEV